MVGFVSLPFGEDVDIEIFDLAKKMFDCFEKGDKSPLGLQIDAHTTAVFEKVAVEGIEELLLGNPYAHLVSTGEDMLHNDDVKE